MTSLITPLKDRYISPRTIKNTFSVKIGLDPARASRKFNEPKPMEDPAVARKELEELKAANRLEKVQELDEDLEKIKQKRVEERRLREEQALMEDKIRQQEQAKKEEAERQAELQRQERIAAQAAAERQADLERKASEEARIAEEARYEEVTIYLSNRQTCFLFRLVEDARIAEELRLAEEARIADEKKAAEILAAK